MTDVADLVCRYARRMHAAIGPAHHVASPLAAWLVLALASSATDDPAAGDEFAGALGMPPDKARPAALALLGRPHPAVHLAAAAWHRDGSQRLGAWLATLGDAVESGPVPTQQDADRWADKRTLGLIKQFPMHVGAQTLLVLASAIACAIGWSTEFTTCSTDELVLPRSDGFARVTRVLRSPPDAATELIVDTEDGPVAVHGMHSADADMLVTCVIAGQEVPHDAVLAHAHRIAVELARNQQVAGRRSLFDLPLGAGHSWVLSEQRWPGGRDEERFDTLLPAWSAQSTHELTALGIPGFATAAAALRSIAGGGIPDTRQVALARYTRTGFEAAAVTGIAMRAAAVIRRSEVRVRTARVEFGHPYAVVAVAAGSARPWAGVPLFSAWVTSPDDG